MANMKSLAQTWSGIFYLGLDYTNIVPKIIGICGVALMGLSRLLPVLTGRTGLDKQARPFDALLRGVLQSQVGGRTRLRPVRDGGSFLLDSSASMNIMGVHG